jgi:CheY-like chemotaxis protein
VATTEPRRRALRVLLVEDNASSARLTELTLEDAFSESGGVDVTHATSLQAALTVLEAGVTADVVIADLGLPDATGLDVVTRLRAAGAPPVIVLSGRDGADLASGVLAAGAAGHVLKGEELLTLAAAVHAAAAPA